MDASSLARDLDNLENSWSSLDWYLNFWTILVVVGVAVELLVIITEYSHAWRDFKRGTVHPPDKPSILLFGLGFLGAALVAIGVAGEFSIHVRAGKIESDMRSKVRELVGTVQRDAGDANREAGDAHKEAGEAEERAGKAVERASKADERASKNETQAARLQKDAEGLKKIAEDEKLARVKIEEKMADRIIPPDSVIKVANGFKSAQIETTIVMLPLIGDSEAARYADQIRAALTLGGAKIGPRDFMDNALLRITMVCTNGGANNKVKRDATSIRDILLSSGITVNTVNGAVFPCTFASISEDQIGVLVPTKSSPAPSNK